jgi:hypothetical protein
MKSEKNKTGFYDSVRLKLGNLLVKSTGIINHRHNYLNWEVVFTANDCKTGNHMSKIN